MSDAAPPGAERCGIDSVEIARIERLLRETPADGLTTFFSAQELADAGNGPGRAASLAARFLRDLPGLSKQRRIGRSPGRRSKEYHRACLRNFGWSEPGMQLQGRSNNAWIA